MIIRYIIAYTYASEGISHNMTLARCSRKPNRSIRIVTCIERSRLSCTPRMPHIVPYAIHLPGSEANVCDPAFSILYSYITTIKLNAFKMCYINRCGEDHKHLIFTTQEYIIVKKCRLKKPSSIEFDIIAWLKICNTIMI